MPANGEHSSPKRPQGRFSSPSAKLILHHVRQDVLHRERLASSRNLLPFSEKQGFHPVVKKLRLSAKWVKNTIPCGEEWPPIGDHGETSMPRQRRAFFTQASARALFFTISKADSSPRPSGRSSPRAISKLKITHLLV
ncbi:MAG: hypothetical protein IJE66_07970 [Akkermansia sp.]|nr:hypothetical protein [Akkermansia sp.]